MCRTRRVIETGCWLSEFIGYVAEFSVEVVYSLGYAGLFLLSVLSNSLFPVPSEVYLPLSGFLVGEGELSLVAVMLVCNAGAVCGSLVVYPVGDFLGRKRLRAGIRNYGRFVFLRERDLDRVEGWFDTHRGRAVFFGRLVPGLGGLISIPAGIRRMSIPAFVLYTFLGCAVWNGAFIGLGWVLGRKWNVIQEHRGLIQYPVYLVLALIVGWFFWSRLRHSRNSA